ncbi:MAG: ATP-binding protein [Chloroflexi bacterium]|nr:ATP-binding protein [Chloroflexota bacterium]
MTKLKPWFDVVKPREDLRTGKPLDASEFAVHLEHVRERRAPDDYQIPERFFERTYITRTLRDLAAEVVRRLSGERVATSAVFNMATQFGGGKTHALTLLYHLAAGGRNADSWRGVRGILSQAGVPGIPAAATAVFVGTEFDSLSGRGGDDGSPRRLTPWGEIGWQLGGENGFERVARHDAQGIAPAGDVIRSFLPSGPTLVLMDELMNYISRNRKTGLSAQLYNFLHNLAEEARARDNLALVVSIPASELEMNSDDQRDYESVKKLLDRVGKAVIMSVETETAEIIRRRLFEWGGLPEEGARTCAEYADWAMEHHEILGDADIDTIRERFAGSYPFHPAVLSVFERKWQSLPRFQRTRGVLRLLALWVSRAYESGYKGAERCPLITLGSAPLEDSYLRAAMFEQLGSDALEGPVTTDIASTKECNAQRLDREASEAVKKARLHQKIATAIFFESNGGMTKAEATLPEIRFAVGEPDLDIANVETALDALVDSCYYLSAERNRYRYSLTPNLNKLLTDRRASVQAKSIEDRVLEEVQSVFRAGPTIPARVYFPEKSGQIADVAVLTLVVLGPGRPLSEPGTPRLIESLIREHGLAGRTFKSALLFAVPEGTSALQNEARNGLAWEDIAGDDETLKRLDDTQLRQLKTGREKAARDLREAVWRTYRYIALLDKDNALKEIDLGLVHSSMAGSLTEVIINRLRQDDEITEAVGPHKLVRYWPAVAEWSTRAARDAFFSSPLLPRLIDPMAIRRTIADGVSQKILAYVGKGADGKLEPFHFGTALSEADIEISNDMFVLTAAEAAKHVEPPRLARVELKPSSAQLRPGQEMQFSVTAYDQHGRPFPIDAPMWSASGGTVDQSGSYVAASTPGFYTIAVTSGEIGARANVQVVSEDARPKTGRGGEAIKPPPRAASGLRWQGNVPHQKWMNFYTKVLSRFVGIPGLRLTVEFEIPPTDAVTQSKVEETRTALRELGLNEELEVT